MEATFRVLRHDDSATTFDSDSFLSRAASVSAVPSARASLSLVLAELRLLKAALAAGCEAILLLSGACLPLVCLDTLNRAVLSKDKSVLQYHFMKGSQQRAIGVPYGALQ